MCWRGIFPPVGLSSLLKYSAAAEIGRISNPVQHLSKEDYTDNKLSLKFRNNFVRIFFFWKCICNFRKSGLIEDRLFRYLLLNFVKIILYSVARLLSSLVKSVQHLSRSWVGSTNIFTIINTYSTVYSVQFAIKRILDCCECYTVL